MRAVLVCLANLVNEGKVTMAKDIIPLEVAPPAPAKATMIADDLLWFRFTTPHEPNYVNLYALDTNDGWLLIDCGVRSDATATNWKYMLHGPLAGKKVAGILVSHHHPDHLGYAGALAALTNAPVYMASEELKAGRWSADLSNQDFDIMAHEAFADFGYKEGQAKKTIKAANDYRLMVWNLPDITIVDEFHVFASKNGKWVVRIDAGHSPGHVSLIDLDRKIYLSLDCLMPVTSPRVAVSIADINDDPLRPYFSYLAGLSYLTNDWLVVPSHDWPFYGGGARATQLQGIHHKLLDDLIEAAGELSLSTADATQRLATPQLSDIGLFYASCEMRAHLNYLCTIGKMNMETENGISQFSVSQ